MEASEVRRASAEDADDVGRLLDAFNTEFDDPTPGPEFLAGRVRELLGRDDFIVMLVGPEPLGVAVVRFRPTLWSEGLEAYIEELYVVPERRGEGLGRALLEATLAEARRAGANRIDLGTAESDTAARGLYASAGFTNLEHGAKMLFYERDL